jgi:hypothetical protein
MFPRDRRPNRLRLVPAGRRKLVPGRARAVAGRAGVGPDVTSLWTSTTPNRGPCATDPPATWSLSRRRR